MARHASKPAKKTMDYYLCLFAVVLPLRAIVYMTPVVMAGLIANQLGWMGTPLSLWLAIPLLAYCVIESTFTLYYLHSKEAAQPLHPNPPQIVTAHAKRSEPLPSALAFFEKLFAHIDDVPAFLEGHFYGVPFPQLTRVDLSHWCAFAFFSKSLAQASAEEIDEIHVMVTRMYQLANRVEPPVEPSSPPRKYLQSNLEPFQATARPFVIYFATMACNAICSMWLRWFGFQLYQATPEIRYWHRPARSTETTPLVFLHGVGIGLLTYVPLLWKLFVSETNRQIFLLDMPYIAMQLSDAVPEKEGTINVITSMLDRHGISTSVHWMGHSFGSIVMSWVCQEKPHLVHYLTFLDPIVFALWLHDGIYNIMYREPSTGFDLILWYFGSQEIGIARTMRRHLCWYESVLFPENLPRHPETKKVLASIFMSEKDCIINAPAVLAHLKRGAKIADSATSVPIHTAMWPGITHGEMILYPSTYADVLSTLK
ncbi:unnamed protein product [Aphanomyces euteiches]